MPNPNFENPKSQSVPFGDSTVFDIESFVNELADPEGTTSLVAALDDMESPILSPAGEGSARRGMESADSVPESPLDPNTRAKVGELLDVTPEKSMIPEVARKVPIGSRSEVIRGDNSLFFD